MRSALILQYRAQRGRDTHRPHGLVYGLALYAGAYLPGKDSKYQSSVRTP